MFNSFVAIDAEHFNCRATDWRLARKDWTIPFEMPCPAIGARIKEGDQFVGLRIVTGYIGAFGGVAIGARKAGILQRCRSSVLPGADMIDFMWQRSVSLGQHTVFAPPPCTFPNELAARRH
jgi:hypothetical protein